MSSLTDKVRAALKRQRNVNAESHALCFAVGVREHRECKLAFEAGADSRTDFTLKLVEKLEEIRWSWENDAGRQCDNLAHEALANLCKELGVENEF